MFLIKSLKLKQQQHSHIIIRFLRNNRNKILTLNETETGTATPATATTSNDILNGFPPPAAAVAAAGMNIWKKQSKKSFEFNQSSYGTGEMAEEKPEVNTHKIKQQQQQQQKNDIENLELIEMNLFENSTKKSIHFNTKTILNKWKNVKENPSTTTTRMNNKNFMKNEREFNNNQKKIKNNIRGGVGGRTFNFNELNRQSFQNNRKQAPSVHDDNGNDKQKKNALKMIDNDKDNADDDSDESDSESKSVDEIKLPYDIKYRTIQSANKYLENLMHCMKSRKYRQRKQQILVEGKRLILDAIFANLKLKTLIFSQLNDFELIRNYAAELQRNDTNDDTGYSKTDRINIEYLKLPYDSINNWSNLKTSPGVIAIFHMENFGGENRQRPREQQRKRPPSPNLSSIIPLGPLPITIVCDQIREPQNLGSIIRTAAAIPCHQLILLKGCTDPWDSKVIRAAAGGHFHDLKIINQQFSGTGTDEDDDDDEMELGLESVGDDKTMNSGIESEKSVTKTINWKNLYDYLRSNVKETEFRLIAAENNFENIQRKMISMESDHFTESELKNSMANKLPKIQEYTKYFIENGTASAAASATSTKNYHYIVIIGGETTGISPDAYQFIRKHNGICLNIPLADGIDSLNTGTALAILLFEIKRNLDLAVLR